MGERRRPEQPLAPFPVIDQRNRHVRAPAPVAVVEEDRALGPQLARGRVPRNHILIRARLQARRQRQKQPPVFQNRRAVLIAHGLHIGVAETAVQKALRARYRGAPARGQSDVQRHARVHKRAPAADVRKPFGSNRAHELAPQRHIEKRPVRADEQHAARRERARPVPHNAQRTPAHEFLVAHANLRARALHKHAKPRRVLRRIRRSSPTPHGKFQPHARPLAVQRVHAYLAGRIREEPPDQPRPLARRVRRKRNPAALHLLAQRRPAFAYDRIGLAPVGVRPVLAKAHLAQLHAQRTIRIDRKQPVKIQLVCVFHRNRSLPESPSGITAVP